MELLESIIVTKIVTKNLKEFRQNNKKKYQVELADLNIIIKQVEIYDENDKLLFTTLTNKVDINEQIKKILK